MDDKKYKNDQDQLKRLVKEESSLNDDLKVLENEIFSLETQYLHDECPHWNTVRGFDNFNERSQMVTRRTTLPRSERLFSLSSHNSPAANLPYDDDIHSTHSHAHSH